MRKVAVLFPGQGAQEVGMGRDLFGRDEFADELAEVASVAAGVSIEKVCTRGPLRSLTQTHVLQPALTVVCLSLWKRLAHGGLSPHVTAGHSIGELSSMVASGLADPIETVKIAALRGELMGNAARSTPGAMAAVTGGSATAVEVEIASVKDRGILSVAAVNAPTQVTLSGDPDRVDEAKALLGSNRDFRITPLRVSGAWHSAHMRPAVAPFLDALTQMRLRSPQIPMVLNRNGKTVEDVSNVPNLIAEQLIRPVRWDLVMTELIRLGTTDFVEVGPGRVLRGLIRLQPESPEIRVHNVSDSRGIDRALKELSA